MIEEQLATRQCATFFLEPIQSGVAYRRLPASMCRPREHMRQARPATASPTPEKTAACLLNARLSKRTDNAQLRQ